MYNSMYTNPLEIAMPTKVRKQIYIEPRQNRLLKQLVRIRGDSEAEIIRRAIDEYARDMQFPARDLDAWEEEKEYIQSLMAKGPVEGKRTWRREDLYDR